jgi:hypothetical protein
MTKDELLTRRTELQAAITNVLEAGQEFHTRNARVKQASLDSLRAELANIDTQLSAYNDSGMTHTTLLVYGGDR